MTSFPGIAAEYNSAIDAEVLVNNVLSLLSGVEASNSGEVLQDGFTIPFIGSFLKGSGKSWGGGVYAEISYTWITELINNSEATQSDILKVIPPELIEQGKEILNQVKNSNQK